MKIAVLSDIHGNLPALEAILSDIKNQNIDKIICLGDVIGIGPSPKECLDLIINNNIELVLGNHELYYVYGTSIDDEMEDGEKIHHEWIKKQLSEKHYKFLKTKELSYEFNNILFEHFLIDKDRKEFYPFYDINILKNNAVNKIISTIDNNFIFVGHEHRPIEIVGNSNTLVVVGSSGCTKDEKTSYIIITIDNNIKYEKKYLNYDRQKFIYNLKNTDYPEKERLSKMFFGIS